MNVKWPAIAAVLAASPASAQVYPLQPPLQPPITPAPALCYTNAPYTLADQYYGYQAAVLNIRAWPNGAIFGFLVNGTPVQVLNVDASTGSLWAYVALANGSAGWVFLPYLYCGT
jgi:hypothetical protein